jgi:hypothetical protein
MNLAGPKVADDEEGAAPVTILDGLGRVVRIVTAAEFRRNHGVPGRPTRDTWRRRSMHAQTGEVKQSTIENALPR